MSPVVLAAAFAMALAFGGAVAAMYAGRRSRDKALLRRLRRVAAPLANRGVAFAGGAAEAEAPGGGESVFRRVERRSRLRRFVESRYPLLHAPRAVSQAVAAGAAASGVAWFSLWFLQIPVGGWTLAVAGAAAAGGMWYALDWMQARQEAEFIRQFPEITDQIVRLAGAGVPAVEALSAAAEDAQEPVRPVLQEVRDALLAGLDADRALRMVSERVQLAEFTLFAAVLRLQRRAGGSISGAFANLSTTLRERNKTALKARASTAQTRLTLLVLALMPVLILIAQKFTAPESIEILFGTEDGTMLLRAGVGLIVTGLLVARAIAARGMR